MYHPPTCSNCRFFQPEGHYHGSCARLHSMVMGEWPGCPLGESAFDLGEERIERQDSSSTDPLVGVAAENEHRLPPKISIEPRSLTAC
jgi:hypothetical protein